MGKHPLLHSLKEPCFLGLPALSHGADRDRTWGGGGGDEHTEPPAWGGIDRTQDKGNITWRLPWSSCWGLHQPWLQVPACKTALDLLGTPGSAEFPKWLRCFPGKGTGPAAAEVTEKQAPLNSQASRTEAIGPCLGGLFAHLPPPLGWDWGLWLSLSCVPTAPFSAPAQQGSLQVWSQKVEETEPLERASLNRGTGGSQGYQGL